MEKLYRVKINKNGAPNFSTAEEVESCSNAIIREYALGVIYPSYIYPSCDNCYYEYFDAKDYPCSLCIRGIKRTDKWMPSKKIKAEIQTDRFPCNSCKNHDECCTKEFEYKYELQTDCSACDTCQWYNSGIPCGVEPGVCKREVKDEPQTDIHDLTDCDFCKDRNCKDCEDGKNEPQEMGSIERPKTGICAKCDRNDCEQKMEHIDNCNGYIEPQTERGE